LISWNAKLAKTLLSRCYGPQCTLKQLSQSTAKRLKRKDEIITIITSSGLTFMLTKSRCHCLTAQYKTISTENVHQKWNVKLRSQLITKVFLFTSAISSGWPFNCSRAFLRSERNISFTWVLSNRRRYENLL